MTEHRSLESELSDVGRHIDWPRGDVSARVHERITAQTPAPQRRSIRLHVALAAAAAVAIVLVVPAGRQAVADLLGVAGIEIGFGDASTVDSGIIDLGDPVTLADAAEAVDFRVVLPELPDIGPPDRIHLQDRGIVNSVWPASSSLPAIEETDIGLLITQFRPVPGESVFRKGLADGTEIESTTVSGRQGVWIEGAPHLLTFSDTSGTHSIEVSRLAGNVLLWEDGGVTYRVESSLDLANTQRIAESLGGS